MVITPQKKYTKRTLLRAKLPITTDMRNALNALVVYWAMQLPEEVKFILTRALHVAKDCTPDAKQLLLVRALALQTEDLVSLARRFANHDADPRARIVEICDGVKEMLLAKNRAYGNSALEPVRIFSKADPVEQIRVRIDDKLSRLARGHAAGEDVVDDLIGYLVLLKVALRFDSDRSESNRSGT
jgi:hypothetical protein